MDTPRQTCLGLFLPSELAAQLQTHLQPKRHLDNKPVQAAIDQVATETRGGLMFVCASVWKTLEQSQRDTLAGCQAWQYLLIADEEDHEVFEIMASGAFLTLLTCPLNAEKIARALDQAEEVTAMYHDIFMMAREISLERELLARKNEQLAFLNQLLTKASQTLDPAVILANSAEDLSLLLDVRAVMGVFWSCVGGQNEAELFIPENLTPQRQEEWISHLLSVATRLGKQEVRAYQLSFVSRPENVNDTPPELHQLITQNLTLDETTFGALVICSHEAATLGQDRVRILDSAANHLALAMRNSLEFRKTKARADHDGLTRISNRQNFDVRLREEMKRHQRHQEELSLMMVDLDYFKSVNDTYGHLAGDMVLREVGKILQKTLRETDFPARYGGEEFVIILPQTREEQAWILAERLRTCIGQTTFRFQKKRFRVTASIGIAGLKPGALAPPEALIHNADQALYRAKTSGRNMVCCSAVDEASSAH